jgi:membrane protein
VNSRWWTAPLRLYRALARFLRGKDLSLHAAGVTFYAGIAVVPVALVTIRVVTFLAGAHWVRTAAAPIVAAMPNELGAGNATALLIDAGVRMSPLLVLVALFPATFYGEGLRRAFVSLAAPSAPFSGEAVQAKPSTSPRRRPSGERFTGWRGRLLILPVLAVGPVLFLALLAVLPRAARLLVRGGWHSVGGVVVSFLAVWLLLSVVLILVYRTVAPVRPGWTVTVLCGSFVAANLSGFAHGFVLFWSLPLDLGAPFGGLRGVGAVVAVALWLYLLHVITLLGYAVTLQVHRAVLLRAAS